MMGVTLRPRRVCVLAWIWDGLEEEREAVSIGLQAAKGAPASPCLRVIQMNLPIQVILDLR